MRESLHMVAEPKTYGRVGRMVRGVAAASAVFFGFLVLFLFMPSKKQFSLGGSSETGLSVAHADVPSTSDSATSDSASGGDSAGGTSDSGCGGGSSDSCSDSGDSF